MKIAFLGDSITLGYALENREKRYSTLVCEMLGAEEENYGITGTLVARAGLNHSDGNDYLSRIGLIDDADVAVVFGGTNDYFWSDAPILGEGDENFFVALTKIVEHVEKHRAGKPTLFVTPYPHQGVGNYFGGETWNTSSRHETSAINYNGHDLKDYVDTTVKICIEHGMPVLDLHENFPFVWQEHTVDGCHPNEAGHALLAQVIAGALKQLIEVYGVK